jgi:hypothetical protein
MSTDKKISQLTSGAPAQAGDEYVVARSGANFKLTLTNIAANMPATTISSGDLVVSSGNVGIGTGTPATKLDIFAADNATTSIRLGGTAASGGGATATVEVFGNRSDGNSTFYGRYGASFRRADGTAINNQTVGAYLFGGQWGTSTSFQSANMLYAASIAGFAESSWTSATAMPTAITFSTGSSGGVLGSVNQSYGTERMRIDSSGNVGIGGTADASDKVCVKGTLPVSSNTSAAFINRATASSSNTGVSYGFASLASTEAASFTLGSITGYGAFQGTFGAGSTVTNQYGFFTAGLSGATNNFGFYSDIASGSNRWNFYAAGTAQNYFAGDVGIGLAPAASTRVSIKGQGATSGTVSLYVANSSSTDLFKIRDDGVVFTGAAANSPYNLTTGSAANVFVDTDGSLKRSTSSLHYKFEIANATHGLADVLKLRSVTYKAKNSGDTVFGGLIAEEVHDAGLTEFVAYDKEGRPDAIHYGNMVALLVKAVQELTARVAELEAK